VATVLVVCPHAMDEALGCGGTIAVRADAGDRIETLVLFGDGSGMDAQRRIAAPQAAKIFGSAEPHFAGFPENRSDSLPLIEVVTVIEKVIAEIRPTVIYAPHGGNLNIDHQTTFRALVTAARPVPQCPVRTIYTYEVLSSTEWAPPQLGQPFVPVHFVDITRTLDRKLRALEHYGAEMRSAPHSRSIEGVRALVQHRGLGVGVVAAEAFAVIRELV